jgi:hypothetical protein
VSEKSEKKKEGKEKSLARSFLISPRVRRASSFLSRVLSSARVVNEEPRCSMRESIGEKQGKVEGERESDGKERKKRNRRRPEADLKKSAIHPPIDASFSPLPASPSTPFQRIATEEIAVDP